MGAAFCLCQGKGYLPIPGQRISPNPRAKDISQSQGKGYLPIPGQGISPNPRAKDISQSPFEIKVDDTGARYVTEKLTEQTKNHQGGSKQSDQLFSDVRMYETSNGLNPVTAFEFYLSKVRPECDALFQTPNKNYARSPAEHWYKNEPLGKNAIAKIMERLSVKAELSQRYTNHCVRASAVTHLYFKEVWIPRKYAQ